MEASPSSSFHIVSALDYYNNTQDKESMLVTTAKWVNRAYDLANVGFFKDEQNPGPITSRDHLQAQIEKDEVLFIVNSESNDIAGTIQLLIKENAETQAKSGYLTTLAVNPDISK